MSEFLDRKLSWRFRTYDADGNGYLERDDFDAASRRLGAEFGHGPDSEPWQRFHALCMELWEHLVDAADTDADGRIDEAEYKDAFGRGVLETDDSFDDAYLPFLVAPFEVVDVGGDGRLDVDEHICWSAALMRVPEARSRAVHAYIDVDGDGSITIQEMLDNIREFYFDESPDSVASLLVDAA